MAATQLLARIGLDAPGSQGRVDPATPTARPAAAPSAETAAPFVPPPQSAPAPASPAIEPTAAESDGAPGLLLRARPGDTLESLYLRIYRSVTPPSFASVAALNPERIRPGDILTFPAPVNGWAGQDDADAGRAPGQRREDR
jgi:hypothetical protein